jgi:hypothetical protein
MENFLFLKLLNTLLIKPPSMIEDRNEKNQAAEESDHREIFSRAVRAGKRTYFFDVKATRRNDYFLTITESKKRFQKDGRFFFEKHKIFLYKEDFDKFAEGFQEVIEFITTVKNSEEIEGTIHTVEAAENYTNVNFDDLEGVEFEEGKHKN